MKKHIWRKSFAFSIAILIGSSLWVKPDSVAAEVWEKGGSAALPAVSAYETWMQFSVPDENTPAIDTDGCLNYALAKLAVRYNLPVEGANIFSDSYTFYTTFTEKVLKSDKSKMQWVAETYAPYLQRLESVSLSDGSLAERMQKAYGICASYGSGREYAFILQMTTASGSDHYVLVDSVDLSQQRLYLLDSGSRYIQYLGDEKTVEKGYYITAVHPFRILSVPGDCNGDFYLTEEDAVLIPKQAASDSLLGDANHDGIVNVADAVYVAKASWYADGDALCYADGFTEEPPIATSTTKKTAADKVSNG